MLNFLRREAPWFAFLVHPRNREEILGYGFTSFLRGYCCSDDECVAKVTTLQPFVLGEVGFGFGPIRGELIVLPRAPEEISTPAGKHTVVAGFELALQRGARWVGLGALTAPATGGGQTLLKHCPAGVTITNGNALTAAMIRRNVIFTSKVLGPCRLPRVAVIGCTGSVGTALTQLLAEDGFPLILIGRTRERVVRAFQGLAGDITMGADLEAVREARIVVVLTNDPSALLDTCHVQSGAIVIDCAQPPNVPPCRYPDFLREGVRVVEGGLVQIPGYASTYNLLPETTDTFACLAETYLFAREGIRAHSVGRPSADLARRLDQAATFHSIEPRPLPL